MLDVLIILLNPATLLIIAIGIAFFIDKLVEIILDKIGDKQC